MNTWIKALSLLLLVSGLLASCAQPNPHPMDMTSAVQSAKSKIDHEALATHYDEVAKEMQAKVDEHKKLLVQYKANPWLYGKQIEGFESHCARLVSVYQQAVDANLQMAEAHRQMARASQ